MTAPTAAPLAAPAPALEASRCATFGHPLGSRAKRTLPPGSGRLAVGTVRGESVALDCYSSSPLRLLLPRARGATVWAIAASHGGGLLGGDEVSVEIEVAPAARACLTTQAETKVYRSPDAAASQALRARVESGALLAILPDPVSPYAGAAYRQRQTFDVAPGGTLVLVDAITAGRSARGERWAARSIRTTNEVTVGGRLVLADSLALDPDEGPPVAERMREFELLATIVLLGPGVAEPSAALLARIGARSAASAPVLAAGSPLAGGAFLRLAARGVEAGLAEIRSALAFLPGLLAEDPLSRRN